MRIPRSLAAAVAAEEAEHAAAAGEACHAAEAAAEFLVGVEAGCLALPR